MADGRLTGGALVGISTSAGRTLGHGFWADLTGTVLTAD
ncbi:hypothetical protein ABH937_007280, partial [Kitasatospora sp. GAS1066B]